MGIFQVWKVFWAAGEVFEGLKKVFGCQQKVFSMSGEVSPKNGIHFIGIH
ncbi:hypothetical protein [Planococcus koreensis]